MFHFGNVQEDYPDIGKHLYKKCKNTEYGVSSVILGQMSRFDRTS